MYVCICNAVTERDIREAAKAGTTSLWDLQGELGVATGCGSCVDVAMSVLEDSVSRPAPPPPRVYVPATA